MGSSRAPRINRGSISAYMYDVTVIIVIFISYYVSVYTGSNQVKINYECIRDVTVLKIEEIFQKFSKS